MNISETEIYLLGAAVYISQRIEFALYGIASHVAHLDVAKKDKHFRELSAEKFLRGDIAEQKATLGRIVNLFGDAFLIKTNELAKFISDRNLIVHNYSRVFVSPPKGVEKRTDGKEFLSIFIHRAERFDKIVRGLLYELMVAAAAKEGRTNELVHNEAIAEATAVYRKHAARYLTERNKA